MLTGLIYKGSVTKTFENESTHTHIHTQTSHPLPCQLPEFQRALKLRWLSSGQCQPEKKQEKKITNLEGYLGQLSFTALLLPLQLA